MYLNGQLLRVHGATIQEDALGHGDALTPGDAEHDRLRAARRSAQTPCAPNTRWTRRCWNDSTRPGSSCGRASARSKGPATGTRTRPALLARRREPGAHRGDRRSAAPLDLRLEPRRRGRRERPRRRRGLLRAVADPLAARLRPDADGRGGRVGRSPAGPPGRAVSRRRRDRRDRLLGLV